MSRASLQHLVERLDSAVHHGGPFPVSPTMIVMHDTRGHSFASSIEYLNTTDEKSASYHYGIEKDGRILRMTPPTIVAYHAGDSGWPNPTRATKENPKPHRGLSVNRIAFGIAWANLNGEPLTAEQIASGLWLCATLIDDHPGITVARVRGHYEVSPGRKTDPLPEMPMDDWRARLTAYLAAA